MHLPHSSLRHPLAFLLLAGTACVPGSIKVGEDTEGTASGSGSTAATDSDGETVTTTDTTAAMCVPDEPIEYGRYRCGEAGHEHQKDPALCQLAVPRPCTDPGEGSSCTQNADCGGGTCEQREDVDFGSYCYCAPPTCETTAACGDGNSCYCTFDGSGRCMPSNCATDADCGAELCAISQDACGVLGLFCTTPEDLCDGEFACVYVQDAARWEPVGALGCP